MKGDLRVAFSYLLPQANTYPKFRIAGMNDNYGEQYIE